MRIADHIETAEPANADSTVFKAIQSDGIFTAVYVFPFRLPEEQLIYFNEQVELLGEAYVEFRAAIPRVLSHGFTRTGSFPFIETEWINGVTLDALIKRNYLFTVDSIINIAEEVSRTMAYCHKLGILHGDINSNKVRSRSFISTKMNCSQPVRGFLLKILLLNPRYVEDYILRGCLVFSG